MPQPKKSADRSFAVAVTLAQSPPSRPLALSRSLRRPAFAYRRKRYHTPSGLPGDAGASWSTRCASPLFSERHLLLEWTTHTLGTTVRVPTAHHWIKMSTVWSLTNCVVSHKLCGLSQDGCERRHRIAVSDPIEFLSHRSRREQSIMRCSPLKSCIASHRQGATPSSEALPKQRGASLERLCTLPAKGIHINCSLIINATANL